MYFCIRVLFFVTTIIFLSIALLTLPVRVRRLWNIVYILMVLLFINVNIYAASCVPHPDPKNDSLIPISGEPFYLENLTIGSPVSDYGSHFGVKASVDNDGDNYPRFDSPERINARNFLNLAHYSTVTSFYGQVDQSYFWFEETFPGSTEHLKPAENRAIQFFPYGWTETASDSTISATGKVLTIGTDTFLLYVNVKNISTNSITISPHFTILKDSDPQREGTNVPGSSFGNCSSYDMDPVNNDLSFICDGTRDSKNIKFVRAIKSSEQVLSQNLTGGVQYIFDIELGSTTLNQNESHEITLVIGYSVEGDALNDAKNLAVQGWSKIQSAGGANALINSISQEWSNFFDNLPVPHTVDSRYIKLYRLSATALRMNIYKRRNLMPLDCSVPAKSHFNFFWAWDTPFQTLGQSEWNLQLAKDNLTTQFAGQNSDGMIRMVIDDNLASNFWPNLTQPPVQGWAIKKIAEMDGFTDIDWLNGVYEKSKKYLKFWEDNRDSDGDGLFEFVNGLETGWDDTPRFHCPKKTNVCIALIDTIDSVDLNSWLYIYYKSMEELAEKLGFEDDRKDFRDRAETLRKNISEKLWDDGSGAFFDRELVSPDSHEFIRVITPEIAFPLFAGAERDVKRVRRIIEEHILNPQEFWGDYPIPTVAYNSPEYDHDDDGYYWQGQIWLMTVYSTLTALYRYGYEEEAGELKKRVLDMMFNANPGGIHETYDALTGRIGWGAGSNGYFGGIGEPSAFQFGWSSAFTMEMLLDRYQRERFLMPDDVSITGFVKSITDIRSGSPYIEMDSQEYETPYIELKSASNEAIVNSKSIYLEVNDPFNIFNADATFKVYLYFPATVSSVSNDGSMNHVELNEDAKGRFFNAGLTGEDRGIKHYIIYPESEGCGCSVNNVYNHKFAGFMVILLITGTFFLFIFDLSKKI